MDRNNLKIFTLILLGMFLISFASALDSLGQYSVNTTINITQTCNDATFITINAIKFPNSTVAIAPTNMTATSSGNFYLIFSSTNDIGRYYVTGISDGCDKVFATYFDIGKDLSTGAAILNLGFLTLIILLLLVVIFAIGNLPTGNDEDDFGKIVDVNNLKYLNYGLYIIAYGLLISIFFLSSNLALTYLTGMFGQVLFSIYKILMILGIPFIILILIVIFINIFKDKEMRNIIERGGSIGDM